LLEDTKPATEVMGFDFSKVPKPEDCLPSESKGEKYLQSTDMPQKVREYIQREIDERKASSIEIRDAVFGDTDDKSWQAVWVRSRSKVRADASFQKVSISFSAFTVADMLFKCVIAYLSDLVSFVFIWITDTNHIKISGYLAQLQTPWDSRGDQNPSWPCLPPSTTLFTSTMTT
jgi:hypothetical protein